MGFGARALLAGGLGCTAAFVVACGNSSSTGLLSAGQHSTLSSRLDAISADVAAGRCGKARTDAGALSSAVENLPSSVNPTLRRNLTQGASTVADLATNHCTTTSTSTSSSTTTTITETSTSSSTTTTPTTTTNPTTSSTQSTTPPSTSTSETKPKPNPPTPTTPAANPPGSGGAGVGTSTGEGQ